MWSHDAGGDMLGEYGFLTQHNIRSTCEARLYVRDMKSRFGIREFLFDSVSEGYFYPPNEYIVRESWHSNCFICNHQRVDKVIVEAYIDEVQNFEPRGRAWLRVDAMAQDPQLAVPDGLDLLGSIEVYDAQSNHGMVVVNVIKPNANLAARIIQRWADFASYLGFQGIHWANEGNFRGCQGCDWRGFLVSTSLTLGPKGMVQNLEFVDGFQYDETLFIGHPALLQFPLWTVSGSTMSVFIDIQRRGAIFDASAAFRNRMSELDTDAAVRELTSRMEQAHCSGAVAKTYAAIADGARSVFLGMNRSIDLSAYQAQALEMQGMSFNRCQDAKWYAERDTAGIQSVYFHFEMLCKDVNTNHLSTLLKDSLMNVGLTRSELQHLEIITGLESTSGENWPTPSGKLQFRVESRDAVAVSKIRTSVDHLSPFFLASQAFEHEDLPSLLQAGCENSITAWWHSNATAIGRESRAIPLCVTTTRTTTSTSTTVSTTTTTSSTTSVTTSTITSTTVSTTTSTFSTTTVTTSTSTTVSTTSTTLSTTTVTTSTSVAVSTTTTTLSTTTVTTTTFSATTTTVATTSTTAVFSAVITTTVSTNITTMATSFDMEPMNSKGYPFMTTITTTATANTTITMQAQSMSSTSFSLLSAYEVLCCLIGCLLYQCRREGAKATLSQAPRQPLARLLDVPLDEESSSFLGSLDRLIEDCDSEYPSTRSPSPSPP